MVGLAPSDRRRILVVDDDSGTRALLHELLTREGYAVSEVPDGPAALQQVVSVRPDLLLLDVMMPGQDGLDVLAVLRRTSDVPVIMLTAKDDEVSRVVGLRLGADDYVTKPFSPAELAARIASVLRRSGPGSPAQLSFDGLEIDLARREVTVGGAPVDMPDREFEVLAFLASSPRRVFSREEILERVWGSSGQDRDPATVTEHVRRVRRRIEPDPGRPTRVRTVRGRGYSFEP